MSRTTVLVGFAEALAAPEVVWSLTDEGFRVVAFARKGRKSSIRHSRHVVCYEICPPEVDMQTSLYELRMIMAAINKESGGESDQRLLFPLDDKAVWLGSRLEFENGWRLAGPPGNKAELALNKCLQIQIARDAGFDVPETVLARNASDVRGFSGTKGFPIILKAAECVPIVDNRVVTCRKWICANHRELEHAIEEWNERVPLLVQPFVNGIGEGLFGLAVGDGVRAWSAHRRLRMMNPQGSGSSACISRPVSEDLRCKADRFIKMTGWRGIFMMELLRDSTGKAWFVELNGRPWGSMALSRCQGLEYPAWQIRLAIDEHSSVGKDQSSTSGVACRHLGREFMHLLFVLRGSKSKAQENWPSFWRALKEILCIHRGDAYYNWRRDDPMVFVADCYYTIYSNLFKVRD